MIGPAYCITLDIRHAVAPSVLPVKQGDNSRVLRIGLVNGGEPLPIGNGQTAAVYAKVGESVLTKRAVIADGAAEIKVPVEWVGDPGKIECEVRVFDRGAMILTSPRFSILVTEALVTSVHYAYWDICPNPGSVIVSTQKRFAAGGVGFEGMIDHGAIDTYAWLIIPKNAIPESGIDIYTADGTKFVYFDDVVKTDPTQGGQVTFSLYRSDNVIEDDVPVIVREKEA